MGINEGGLVQIKEGKLIIHSDDLPSLKCRFVSGILEDKDGKIWFGTSTGIIFYFNNNSFHEIERSDGYKLSSNPSFWEIDNDNNIWICAIGCLAIYNGINWKTYNVRDGLTRYSPLYDLHQMKDGSTILITFWSINKYDAVKDTWKEFHFKYKKMFPDEMSVAFDKEGNVWIYNQKNFGVFDGNNWKQEKMELKGKIFIDSRNRIWVPEINNLKLYENNKWTDFKDIIDAWKILEDKYGTIWIATKSDGIISYSEGKFYYFREKDGLVSSEIKNFFLIDGNDKWAIIDGGICHCSE